MDKQIQPGFLGYGRGLQNYVSSFGTTSCNPYSSVLGNIYIETLFSAWTQMLFFMEDKAF